METTARATVYTTGPQCVQCKMTYRELDRQGITYDVVNLVETPAAREFIVEELGYTEAPVVIDNHDEQHHWSGFRPDLIKTLADRAL